MFSNSTPLSPYSSIIREAKKRRNPMAPVADLGEIQVEDVKFPPEIKPPASAKTLFLGGAGVRALEIGGNSVKFTAIGVYLEEDAVPLLASKWSGKSAAELMDSVEFFREIVTGPLEKFTNVTMILPLTGQQYAEKVAENCAAAWKSMGIYTEEGAEAIRKFIDAFKNETFPPGSSILFTHLPPKTLSIGFSQDGCIPKEGRAIIENKLLSESVLESIVGKHGVSPAARLSLANRFFQLFNQIKVNNVVLDHSNSSNTSQQEPNVADLTNKELPIIFHPHIG